MTVQELIDELLLIENKELPARVFSDDFGDWFNVSDVTSYGEFVGIG